MKACFAVALLALIAQDAQAVNAKVRAHNDADPLGKVFAILDGLQKKIKQDAQNDLIAYKDYQKWCKDGKKDFEFEIEKRNTDKQNMLARIAQAKASIHADQEYLNQLASDIMSDNKELSQMAMVRAEEHLTFSKENGELLDSVDTLDRAINILQRNLKGASAAFLQAKLGTSDVKHMIQTLGEIVDGVSLSLKNKDKLVAFAQMNNDAEDEDSLYGAPDAEVYNAQSGSIVEVMEDLRAKAESTQRELKKQELDAQHSYDKRKQALLAEVENDNSEESQTKQKEAEEARALSEANGGLSVAESGIKEGTESLETLIVGCKTQDEDYKRNALAREEELRTIQDAEDDLRKSTAGAKQRVYNGGESFIQLSSTQRGSQVINILRGLAHKEQSRALTQLTSRVTALLRIGSSTGEDPFAKVKGLINAMVKKLEAEAEAEASHKEWCDKQTAETGAKGDKLQSVVDTIGARIDESKADEASLREEVAETEEMIKEATKQQDEMDNARHEQHLSFVQSKSDLDQGLNGVRMAVKVLRAYYAKPEDESDEEDDESFLQIKQTDGDLPVRPSHVKATTVGTDIVQMLEVVESDFGRNLASITEQEETAAAEYKEQSAKNKKNKLQLIEEAKFKASQADQVNQRIVAYTEDREGHLNELDAVLEYGEGVHESCEVKPESYEERKERREAEISGLKQALSALRGEAFLQGHHALRGNTA